MLGVNEILVVIVSWVFSMFLTMARNNTRVGSEFIRTNFKQKLAKFETKMDQI